MIELNKQIKEGGNEFCYNSEGKSRKVRRKELNI